MQGTAAELFEEDEFFGQGESDGEGNFQTNYQEDRMSGLAFAESKALEERFHQIGFHEAYDAAKGELLQEGFETGYSESFNLSRQIGKYLGKAVMQANLETTTEKEAFPHDTVKLIRKELTAPNLSSQSLLELQKCLELQDKKRQSALE